MGFNPENTAFTKFGGVGCFNSTLGTAFAIMNNGAANATLPNLATGEFIELVSTVTGDGLAGIGARQIQLNYLLPGGSVSSHTMTMNGMTAVTAITMIARLIGMNVVAFGSTNGALGDITARVAGGGASRMMLLAGHNTAAPGRTTVPNGKTGFYRGFRAGNATLSSGLVEVTYLVEADIDPVTGNLSEHNYTTIDWATSGPASGQVGDPPANHIGGGFPRTTYLPQGTTIRMRAKGNAANVTAAGWIYMDIGTTVT